MVDCVSLETGSAGCPNSGRWEILAKGGSGFLFVSVFVSVSIVSVSTFVTGSAHTLLPVGKLGKMVLGLPPTFPQ